MWIVTRDASHLRILKTLALAKVSNLVCDSIFFGSRCDNRFVMFGKIVSRAELKGHSKVFHGIAVALRANIDLSFTFKLRRFDDLNAIFGIGILLMEVNMLNGRAMTRLARHTKQLPFAVVLIERTRHMLGPCVMALKTTDRQGSREITIPIWIKVTCRPIIRWVEPNHRKFSHEIGRAHV